jgi:putative sterol carrier protein
MEIMADRETVMETLKIQRGKFSNEKVASSFKGWNRTMQYLFPDIALSVVVPVFDGIPGDIAEGKAENPQVIYEMSSDTFLSIHRKEITGMQAFMKKLVKVKASMPDLLKLQKLDAI